jgi:hypothetical protein
VFYLPALAAMIVIGLLLSERGHRAAPWLLWAAAIFAVSVTLRSLDLSLCDQVVIDGRKVGTHFAWHVLNALALFLLLRASIETGPVAAAEPLHPPLAEPASGAEEAVAEAAPAEPPPEPEPAEKLASSSEEAAKEEAAAPEAPGAEKPKLFFPA